MAVTTWGQWGDVEGDAVKVFVIGDNNFALFLDVGGGNHGIAVTVTSVRARLGDRYREILNLQTSVQDESGITDEPESWKCVINIRPGNSAFYDFVVERKGRRGAKNFEETELYRFNGQKYVANDFYR